MTDSPCVSVCVLDADDLCLGCFRTIEEIAQWSAMDDEQREQAMQRIKERSGD